MKLNRSFPRTNRNVLIPFLLLLALLFTACTPLTTAPTADNQAQIDANATLIATLRSGATSNSQPAGNQVTSTPFTAAHTNSLATATVVLPTLSPTETLTIPAPTRTSAPPPTIAPTQAPAAPVRFAVIGDFGGGGTPEKDVADLVKSWKPDFIVTVGDNNYPEGAAESIDKNIGQFYHDYINDYHGKYGAGSDKQRFFPVLGNHDWNTDQAKPYFDYFTLPGNERYYTFTWGPMEFFMIDSDSREPDGLSQDSVQAQWLKEQMAASNAPWKIVVLHHAPYSSGLHGSTTWMRWPFAKWGASVVLTGHDHTYERLNVDGIPYFVDGVGGGAIYHFVDILPESQFRYNGNYGAMLVTVDERQMKFEFYSREGKLIDSSQIQK